MEPLRPWDVTGQPVQPSRAAGRAGVPPLGAEFQAGQVEVPVPQPEPGYRALRTSDGPPAPQTQLEVVAEVVRPTVRLQERLEPQGVPEPARVLERPAAGLQRAPVQVFQPGPVCVLAASEPQERLELLGWQQAQQRSGRAVQQAPVLA